METMKKDHKKSKILTEITFSIFLFITLLLIFPLKASAQKDTVNVADYFDAEEDGTLNTAVQTAIDAGTLSNTVFKLRPSGLYILDGTITTPPGETIEIVAPTPANTHEKAPPMIAWTTSTSPDKKYTFDIVGEIKMKNVWILYASLDGIRAQSAIRVGDSVPVDGGRCEFDNFGFSVPFTDSDRRILFANNNYFLDQWLIDWMGYGPNGNPYSIYLHENNLDNLIPVPMPMLNYITRAFFDSTDGEGNKVFPYMNTATLYDATDPGFLHPPNDIDSIKEFLHEKWFGPEDRPWAWKPENSLVYTNDTLLTAGMGGFPLGDLYRWFPEKYTDWKAKKSNENERINKWLETAEDPGITGINESEVNIPGNIKLYKNYPNPFNPTTIINHELQIANDVNLSIYNLLGQKVANLVSGKQPAGYYQM
jgi:hypothetical protein